jgi:hypothetical protein
MSNTITIGGYVAFSGYTCELNPDGRASRPLA